MDDFQRAFLDVNDEDIKPPRDITNDQAQSWIERCADYVKKKKTCNEPEHPNENLQKLLDKGENLNNNITGRKDVNTVICRRVQGGEGSRASQHRITVDPDGKLQIANKKANLSTMSPAIMKREFRNIGN